MKLRKINSDRLLGLSAMVISLLTLIIFIYQTNIMREQSKLSVKPRLAFVTNFESMDSTVIFQQLILNKGLGPALIDSIYFKHNGSKHTLNLMSFLKSEVPQLSAMGNIIQSSTMSSGSTLTPDEEKSIFIFELPYNSVEEMYTLLDIQKDETPFLIEVIYTSLYEDEYWRISNKETKPEKLSE